MREEDEIRAAVVALAEAAERGEDILDELPVCGLVDGAAAEGEGVGPEGAEEALSVDELRERAIAAVMDAVRAATRESRLSRPSEWEAAGLVPEGLTAEDVEMAVYDRLMEAGAVATGELPAAETREEGRGWRPRNRHVVSAFSSSNGRPVGAPAFKRRGKVQEGGDGGSVSSVEERQGQSPCPTEGPGAGAEMGEPTAVAEGRQGHGPCPTEEREAGEEPSGAATPAFPECEGIRLLMGGSSYYLYDSTAMTDAFARWAFLAAEDDPVTTFIECVREESEVYPRPMARANLANDPFRMSAEAVEEAFDAAREQGRADDIERTVASNGDVYFYSTRFLTPRIAGALAEWDAVERYRNI